ncbi:MAG: hypothetical protein JXR96_14565 [Deltaproteobacteria bacterium]|nr:hypothetical protein [Deltaproteobacteria bacterium]
MNSRLAIRNIPARVVRALREWARRFLQCLNNPHLEALSRQAGSASPGEPVYSDLDYLAGRWEEDPDLDAAITDQDRIDESLWR